jgi:signal transduction histidine kinase
MAAAVAIGDGVRARRGWRAEQRQRAQEAELEREREAARRVQEERLRIAREVHDVLAHSVAVISLHTDVADEAIVDDPAAAQAALGRIRTASRDTMRELRTTIGLLRVADRPEPDAPAGLDQIDQIVSAATAGGLRVAVEVHGERHAVPAVVDATGYRIVQEALTNTLRHANANGARVCVRYAADRVEIRVTDDGCGPGGTPGGGHGLTGMCERAALLGGHVRAGGRPEGGFAVEASLPLVPS